MASVTTDPSQHHDLYIALFARTLTPRTYHWTLLVCESGLSPTATNGVRYHVTNSIPNPTSEIPNPPPKIINGGVPWRFEAQPLASLFTASPLLGRMRVSRIADANSLPAALEAVPLIQGDKNWTCRVWVRDALASLAKRDIIDLPPHLSDPGVMVMTTTDGRLTLTDEAWTAIENTSFEYLESKYAIGRWRDVGNGRWVQGQVPTWDLWAGKEVVA